MALPNQQINLIKNSLKRVYDILLDELQDIIDDELNRDKKKKRLWIRNWKNPETNSNTNEEGESAPLCSQFLTTAENNVGEDYRTSLRMTTENFNTLLSMIKSKIQKEDTLLREAIPSKVMLDATLNFLATGNTYRSLEQIYKVSKASISSFIPEVCDAICLSLKDYIKVPRAHEEWKTISDGFNDQWNFPQCCGALDGKHILIVPPSGGKECYSYEGSSSVVLIIVGDHKYCVSYFEVVKKSSQSESVFENSSLSNQLENDFLPKKNFLVGDDAFPLKTYLMKPYTSYNKSLSQKEKIFNYRLSRARRIVENIFGILFSRFRAFDRKLAIRLETINKIVHTACALHNWLTMTSAETYIPDGTIDEQNINTGEIVPGQWRSEISGLRNLERFGCHLTTKVAETARDGLKDYFNGEGAVSWQYSAAKSIT